MPRRGRQRDVAAVAVTEHERRRASSRAARRGRSTCCVDAERSGMRRPSARSRGGRSAAPGMRGRGRRLSRSSPADRSIVPCTSAIERRVRRSPVSCDQIGSHATWTMRSTSAAAVLWRSGAPASTSTVSPAAIMPCVERRLDREPHHLVGRGVGVDLHRVDAPRQRHRDRTVDGSRRQADQLRLGPEPGHRPGGAPAAGAAQDRRRAGVVGGLPAACVIAAVIRSPGESPVRRVGSGRAGPPTAGSSPPPRPARRCGHRAPPPAPGRDRSRSRADSITASVPSNTALATSLTSARVGDGAVIIVSSICVAVITGTPNSTQWRTIRFCRWGTSSSGQSMPRSPRATMIASDTATISVRLSSAALVSILATSWARSPTTSRTSSMSAGAAHERHRDEVDARRRPSSRRARGPRRSAS